MRYLFSLLLAVFSLYTLVAQTTQYVWAPSGLTMRVEGKSGAEKIGVVPYGSKVELTGNIGERITVPVFEAFTVELYDEPLTSLPWGIEDNYVEVDYRGEKGWIFAGYLYRYQPIVETEGRADIHLWLDRIVGEPDTVKAPDVAGGSYREAFAYTYKHGITRIDEYGEGWGSTTWAIPLGELNDGYLLGEAFFGLSEQLAATKKGEEYSTMILEETKWGHLKFAAEMETISIRIVGGMLLITSEGGC